MKYLLPKKSFTFPNVAAFGSVKVKSLVAAATMCVLFAFNANAQVSLTATAGTATGTFTTLNAAFTAINAGTHKGDIVITISANTTEPATPVPLLRSNTPSSYSSILIKPNGNVTINSASSPAANRGIIELAGADNVTIDGDDPLTPGERNLSIVASTSTTAGIACIRLSSNSTSGTDGATNNTVINCIITGSRSAVNNTTTNYGIQFSNGVSTSSSSTGAYGNVNTTIENNLITRAYYGVYMYGASTSYYNTGLVIKNNVIGSSTPANIIGLYGIYLSYTSNGTVGRAIVEDNDIQVGDPGTTGYSTSLYGIYLTTGANGTIIRNNNIHDVKNQSSGGWGAHGISIQAAISNVEIYNNFIRDIVGSKYSTSLSTIYLNYGIYISSGATNLKINHNTIVLNQPNTTGSTTNHVSACILITTTAAIISEFYNNILVNNQGSYTSGAYCLVTAGTANISSAAMNNNNYYANTSGKIGYYNGNGHTTLAAWQTATGKDGLSLNEIPPFASATDLHIPANSITLLESAGAPVATTNINSDIDGQTRPGASSWGFGTAPDIGADEFDGKVVYTCTTPNPGNTVTSNNNLCYGKSTTLSLQNATTGTGVSYQWQSSNDNTTYTNIATANSPTYSITPTEGMWYRCKVKCLAGPDSTYSTPIHVVFANNILTSTNGTRCGSGPVTLQATATAGTTINWYTSPSGGTIVGSNSPFTTPSLTATTNFYAASEIITPGEITVGTGNTTMSGTGASPFPQVYESGNMQFLVLAADVVAAGLASGNITGLSVNVTSKASSLPFTGYTIKMANVPDASLAAFNTTASFTTVYGPTNYSSVLGNNTFTFSNNFVWDGTSNILINICFDNDPTGTLGTMWTSNDVVEARTTTYTPVRGYYADDATLCANPSSGYDASATTLPVFKFNGNSICSSPRKLVTATVTPAPAFDITQDKTVCNNAITPLTVLTGNTDYNNVTWSPVTGLYTNAAATTPYVAGTHAATVYHKSATVGTVMYTAQALNTTNQCGGLDTIKIQTLPATTSALAAASPLCLSGYTTLSLTPSIAQTNVKYLWQVSSDNSNFTDIAGANTDVYQTPVITSTKYYRVAVRNSDSVLCFNSVTDTVKITDPTVTAPNVSRCGPGPVTLTATLLDGIATWYDVPSGGTSLATGTTFTTPSLTTDATFYVEGSAGSPSEHTIGNGTSTTSTTGITPFSGFYESQRTQYLYRAADLNAAGVFGGQLNSIAFNITQIYSTLPYVDYRIKIGQTTATTLSTTAYNTATLTEVYHNPSLTLTTTGWNTYVFSTPYNWDGSSNLIIEVCFQNDPNSSGTYYSSSDYVQYTNMSYNACYGKYADNFAACGGNPGNSISSYTNLPNIKLLVGPCSSPRIPVIAQVKPPVVSTHTPTGNIAICNGGTTTLTSTGDIGTYQWLKNGAIISGATNNSYGATSTGAYRLVTTNIHGCSDTSVATNLTVNPLPTVNLGNDTTYCSNGLLTLNATNAGATYLWNTGATTATLTPTISGTYSVTATYPATGCSKADTVNIVINAAPNFNLGNDTNFCAGNSITLNATSTNATYLWENNSTAATRTVTSSGTYRVTVTNNFGCIKRDTIIVTVNPMPVVNLGNDTTVCNNVVFPLNATNPSSTYLWSNGATTPTINVTTPGIYHVTVTRTGNCIAKDTIAVMHSSAPTTSIGNDTTICAGTSLTLNATTPSSTYLWDNNATTATRTVAAAGIYNVTITNQFGCFKRDTIEIAVSPLPVVNLGQLITICDGATVQLNAQNPGASYLWDNNATSQTRSVTTSGTYHVTVTNPFHCVGTDTVEVVVNPLPIVDLGADSIICRNVPIILDAQNAGDTYAWNTGATSQTISVNQAGTYTVMVTNQYNCNESDTIEIDLLPLPINNGFDFLPLFNVESGRVRFMPVHQNPDYIYTWQFGDGSTSDSMIVEHVYATTGTYNVSLTVNDGCADTTRTLELYVDKLTGIAQINNKNIDVRIYPNPANASLNVAIEGNKTTIEKATIINALGQEVQSINPRRTNVHNLEIDLSSFTSGFYFLRLETSAGFVTRKFEVVK
jgi:hypothetical protein